MPGPQIQRLGIYGGTFDPLHTGHLCIAEGARDALQLDQVLFIPACVSPFKLGQTAASAADRLAMVELAIAGNPAFAASRIEIDRPGPSYTVDTLRQVRAQVGAETALYLILGSDSLAAIAAWRAAQELPKLARIAVYPRPGYQPDLAALEARLPGISQSVVLLDAPRLDISATDIRSRVQAGRSIRYLVPAAVEAYIQQHTLYRTLSEMQAPSGEGPCC